MKKAVIGTASAESGTKGKGYVDLMSMFGGVQLRFPVIIVNGADEGPTLLVSGCVHGCEVNGGLSIIELARRLDPKKMKGTVIGAPVVNLPAVFARKRGNEAFDDFKYDLNRIWPGRPDGYPMERLAHKFVNEIAFKADYHIDLHSGADKFYMFDRTIYGGDQTSFDMAKHAGTKFISRAVARTRGNLTVEMIKKGKPSITFEMRTSRNVPDVRREIVSENIKCITNVMKHIGMLDGEPELPREIMYVKRQLLWATVGGFLVYEPNFEMAVPYEKGALLAKIIDVLGEEVERVEAPYDGMVIGVRTDPVIQPGNYTVNFCKVVEIIKTS